MENKPLVLVTGGSGMVGRNLQDLLNSIKSKDSQHDDLDKASSRLKENRDNESLLNFLSVLIPSYNFEFQSSKDLDLLDFQATNEYFRIQKPELVIHLAA